MLTKIADLSPLQRMNAPISSNGNGLRTCDWTVRTGTLDCTKIYEFISFLSSTPKIRLDKVTGSNRQLGTSEATGTTCRLIQQYCKDSTASRSSTILHITAIRMAMILLPENLDHSIHNQTCNQLRNEETTLVVT